MITAGVLAAREWPRPVRRVSPSRYAAWGECWLRQLWEACWKPPLLPVAPAARLGTVVHAVLEAAGKKEVEATEVEACWEQCLLRVENSIAENWVERCLQPLRLSVPDFEVRRLRAVRRAKEVARCALERGPRAGATVGTGTELWVQSADELVGGNIDLVQERPEGLVLSDFKTGLIREPNSTASDVKPEYQVQLQLYAALYASSFNQWPVRLELVPLSGSPVPVPFDKDECVALLGRASALVRQVNERLETALAAGCGPADFQSLATPSPSTCRYCLFRPACPAYASARGAHDTRCWPHDVFGELQTCRTLGNGRLALAVTDGARPEASWVRGIDPDPERHPALLHLSAGCRVALSNVRLSASTLSYSELMSTTIYVVTL